ncbi:MAG: NAD(P)/FAD-dependent oxidoreductase [Candidatus Micrarchaeota archaeon]|nr:NAD(P)/FAD-dependent oxidoreductase [Candidatus Micrarchaeota archaeon]
MRQNVAVIGAGTAGLITARKLSELGIQTTIYDQKPRPGFPVRASGILSINGLETLGVDYKRVMTNTLHGAILHIGKENIRVRSQKPMAYVLERLRLNELCQDEAVSAGAEVKVGAKADGVMLDSLSKSNIIVGADGAVSTVARHFNFPAIEKHILTFRAEYDFAMADPSMVELFFDKDITPGFFGWIAAESKDTAEIGIGIDSRFGNSKAAFERFKKVPEIAEIVANGKLRSEGASVIPVGIRKRFVDDSKGVLLVGDAAGHIKPTTGGGIIFGGNGALYAAKGIEAHINRGVKLSNYEKLWRKEFEKEVRLHDFFYNVYASLNKKNLENVARAMRILKLDSFLSKYGDMDRPSLVIKRFFLRGLTK